MVDVNSSYRCGGADFSSALSCRGSDCLGDGAHSPDHVPVEALHFKVATTEQVEEQPERCAGIIRATVFAIDIVGEKERFDLFGLVVTVKKLAQAAGQKRNQLRDFVAGDPAKPLAYPQQFQPALQAVGLKIGRRLQEKWLQIPSQ